MARFVILRHELPAGSSRPSHWDLMFERAGTLRTWAVEREPDFSNPQSALALADHRLDYLDYEGPVSGDRGSVTRWDRGEYTIVAESAGEWVVVLSGSRLVGRMTLARAPADHSWRVSFAAAPTSGGSTGSPPS
ncbi:MAG: DNA polymerase ligase N-terminal domain-containing protein [Pirellulales bacterium]